MSLINFSNSYPSRYNRFYNEDLFNDMFNNSLTSKPEKSIPAVNIKEDEGSFILEVATPGLKKEDLKLEVNNDTLTISSEKEEKKEEKNENFNRQEFYYQSFSRSFILPKTVNSDGIKAHYENGILEIAIPKKEETKPKAKAEIAIL